MGAGAFISGLLGSDSIVEAAKQGIDKAILTDEERHDMWIKYLEATLPMKRARRMIAVIVTFVWALYAITAMILVIIEHPATEPMLDLGFRVLMPGFTAVIAFYFWRSAQSVTPRGEGK